VAGLFLVWVKKENSEALAIRCEKIEKVLEWRCLKDVSWFLGKIFDVL
jgi:hypothetical protein